MKKNYLPCSVDRVILLTYNHMCIICDIYYIDLGANLLFIILIKIKIYFRPFKGLLFMVIIYN